MERWLMAGVCALALTAQAKAPQAGERADFLSRYGHVEKKLISLVEAMSEKQLNWRPAEGVRSWSEALAHLTVAQYKQAAMLGTPVPKDVDLEAIDGALNKEKRLAALRASYAQMHRAVEALEDREMDGETRFWGRKATRRYVTLAVLNHSAEHLGQGIAYGRMQGVTPPWSKKP